MRVAALHLAIPLAVALAAAAAVWGHTRADAIQREVTELRAESDAAERFLLALARAEAAMRGALLFQRPADLEELHRQMHLLEAPPLAEVARRMDAAQPAAGPGVAEGLASWLAHRRESLGRAVAGDRAAVTDPARLAASDALAAGVRAGAERFLAEARARRDERKEALQRALELVLWLVLIPALLSLLALLGTWRLHRSQALTEARARDALAASSAELGTLREVGELLQACDTAEDVGRVAQRSAERLLPGSGLALFLVEEPGSEALARAGAWQIEAPEALARAECWALKRGRPHAPEAAAACAACAVTGCLCLPLTARSEALGVVWVGGRALSRAERKLAGTLADQLALALADIRLREELRAQALRDPLTGLNNRRFLDELGEKLCLQTMRRNGQLCVVMIDLDHFKALNDAHGHAAGDAALRRTGQIIAEGLRRSDICCRYGGEEFALILPDCSAENGAMRAEQLRRRIERGHDAPGTPAVTASFGVAALPASGTSMRELLRAADEALYRAKKGGRNRVETAVAAAAPELPPTVSPTVSHPGATVLRLAGAE